MESNNSAPRINNYFPLDSIKSFGVCNGEAVRFTVLVKVKTETFKLSGFSLKD